MGEDYDVKSHTPAATDVCEDLEVLCLDDETLRPFVKCSDKKGGDPDGIATEK